METGSNIAYMLLKMAMFVTVQALVYVILSKSSNVFSKKQRSISFKTTTSSSINACQVAAELADIPSGEPSPNSADWRVLSREIKVHCQGSFVLDRNRPSSLYDLVNNGSWNL